MNPKIPTENVTMEELEFGGDMDSKYPMETLKSFSALSSLKKLELYCIKPKDNSKFEQGNTQNDEILQFIKRVKLLQYYN